MRSTCNIPFQCDLCIEEDLPTFTNIAYGTARCKLSVCDVDRPFQRLFWTLVNRSNLLNLKLVH